MKYYYQMLERIINDGIEAVKIDYKEDADRYNGAIAGFEVCRNKSINELFIILQEANEYMDKAFREQAENYWWFRCYQAEVNFVNEQMNVFDWEIKI